MSYQIWLAERAVHAAALHAVTREASLADLAERILEAYAGRYLEYPNRDNALGPTRPFFSTYLESIWLLQLAVAVSLLETTGRARGGRRAAAGSRHRAQRAPDRVVRRGRFEPPGLERRGAGGRRAPPGKRRARRPLCRRSVGRGSAPRARAALRTARGTRARTTMSSRTAGSGTASRWPSTPDAPLPARARQALRGGVRAAARHGTARPDDPVATRLAVRHFAPAVALRRELRAGSRAPRRRTARRRRSRRLVRRRDSAARHGPLAERRGRAAARGTPHRSPGPISAGALSSSRARHCPMPPPSRPARRCSESRASRSFGATAVASTSRSTTDTAAAVTAIPTGSTFCSRATTIAFSTTTARGRTSIRRCTGTARRSRITRRSSTARRSSARPAGCLRTTSAGRRDGSTRRSRCTGWRRTSTRGGR